MLLSMKNIKVMSLRMSSRGNRVFLQVGDWKAPKEDTGDYKRSGSCATQNRFRASRAVDRPFESIGTSRVERDFAFENFSSFVFYKI